MSGRGARGERLKLVAMVGLAGYLIAFPESIEPVREQALRGRAWLAGVDLRSVELSERARLEAELARLRNALAVATEELRAARASLRAAGEVEATLAEGAYRLLPARVIARSEPRERRRMLVLARGADGGVVAGMPVVSGAALVGLVRTVSATSCRVALLTDPDCRVLVTLVSGEERTPGGASVGTLAGVSLRFIRVEHAPTEGALVVTTGAESRIPPGLLVGRVEEVDVGGDRYEAGIELAPAVSLDALEWVHVLDLEAPAATAPEPAADGPVGR